MPNLKSLFDLWDEYLNGVGGRKPARLFSETERGRVKYKYTRRKVVWDIVRKLVDLGHSSHRAIDMIYNVYGAQTSVTDIINRLRRDKKMGHSIPIFGVSLICGVVGCVMGCFRLHEKIESFCVTTTVHCY